MAFVIEIVRSGAALQNEQSPTRERQYYAEGYDDEEDVIAAVIAASPSDINGLIRRSVEVSPIDGDKWYAIVKYDAWISESEFIFDTTGGTQHITMSLETINRYNPAGEAAVDHGGAIGVDVDSVKGCDIVVPALAFSERHKLDQGTVTGAYKLALAGLTGKVNNGSFKGFSAGEVLFMGASGRLVGNEKWDIEYRFVANPNITGLTMGTITGIAKKGHEYLWVEFVDDDSADNPIKKPRQVNIARDYQSANFAGIGIGT